LGELEMVRLIGCNVGQGYLFRRPVPQSEFTDLLRIWSQQMKSWACGAARQLSRDDFLQRGWQTSPRSPT